ncbi:6-phosphogluconolactonase [uncultured Cocleimonas sp.]|uniref:6-phosphogluconolactonase n=1 Tax=uncultured Cocleimonas sp. TaxID=1051587 RepID=UPI00262C9E05|nr:6-phosphogluconolactonase [uncultured Cocleimonas sp.]
MKNTLPKEEWLVESDASAVAKKSYLIILRAAKEAIEENGVFRIVLAGGTTPERIYRMLAAAECDWQKWEIFLGDERCLPESSPERNSQIAMKAWLNDIEIPAENVHFIPSELGADLAAKNYAETIKSKMPFDLVLLGMGEDGHTASLFPGHMHNEEELVHGVHNAPKPPSDRVSLSTATLSNSEQVLIIITGAGKKASVKAWNEGEPLPIAKISAINMLTVILDSDASPA